jgi:hypothetical protein
VVIFNLPGEIAGKFLENATIVSFHILSDSSLPSHPNVRLHNGKVTDVKYTIKRNQVTFQDSP